MAQFPEQYTFEDISLVPQYNNSRSRTVPSLETWLTKNVKMDKPILAANMDTVICPDLAVVLQRNGIMPIFHRFARFETQLEYVKSFPGCFISSGLDDLDNILKLLDAGAKGVCIDTAHGHSEFMLNFIRETKKQRPKTEIIAGNICTEIAFQDLTNAGADAIKVGIGGGSVCSTRMVTGFGVPQFSAIYNCAKIAKKLGVPLIADGGIKHPRDIVLALAAGASSVMIGSLFAKTAESATVKQYRDGRLYGLYRGQASAHFQNEYYGAVKPDTVPEGIHFDVEITQTAQQLIDELCGGVRSGLTYGGAKNIRELQRKSEFIKVTPNFMNESKPRPETSSLQPPKQVRKGQ